MDLHLSLSLIIDFALQASALIVVMHLPPKQEILAIIILICIYRVSPKKLRFSLEAYISASRVLNDKTKTTIGKVFQRAFQNSP